MRQPAKRCPVTLAATVTGGEWKPRLLWAPMRGGRMRFAALRCACPPISDRLPSKEPKEREAWGLMDRRGPSAQPLATDRGMTGHGRSLEPVMGAMASWGAAREMAGSGAADQDPGAASRITAASAGAAARGSGR
ncbi:MAG: helix-turn-helix transcriptional regulator [Gluconacetobacter diazotrophicus]|nr:helix-turn-helix transcriptional regulator [Gluconacetobacter diazotrophicus]